MKKILFIVPLLLCFTSIAGATVVKKTKSTEEPKFKRVKKKLSLLKKLA